MKIYAKIKNNVLYILYNTMGISNEIYGIEKYFILVLSYKTN